MLLGCTNEFDSNIRLNIIPQPNFTESKKGILKLGSEVNLSYNNELCSNVGHLFKSQMNQYLSVNIVNDSQTHIYLELIESGEQENYELTVSKDKILIRSGSEKGLFYGLQSLRQLVIFAEKKT